LQELQDLLWANRSNADVRVEDACGRDSASAVDSDATRQLAAEEITGHKYETISVWLKQAASHAETITQVLATNLHLSQVEIDEFWSFVQKNRCPPADHRSSLAHVAS
jgi:hypothetical protein